MAVTAAPLSANDNGYSEGASGSGSDVVKANDSEAGEEEGEADSENGEIVEWADEDELRWEKPWGFEDENAAGEPASKGLLPKDWAKSGEAGDISVLV